MQLDNKKSNFTLLVSRCNNNKKNEINNSFGINLIVFLVFANSILKLSGTHFKLFVKLLYTLYFLQEPF